MVGMERRIVRRFFGDIERGRDTQSGSSSMGGCFDCGPIGYIVGLRPLWGVQSGRAKRHVGTRSWRRAVAARRMVDPRSMRTEEVWAS